MNRYIMDEYYRMPNLHERLDAAARRERARAFKAGFAWLVRRLSPRFHFGPSSWTERLG